MAIEKVVTAQNLGSGFEIDVANSKINVATQVTPVSVIDSLIKPSNWVATPIDTPLGSWPDNWKQLNGGVNQNSIVNGTLPSGETGLIWKTASDGNYNSSGGFTSGGGLQDVLISRTYRVSGWFKKSPDDSGSVYLGLYSYNAAGTNSQVTYAHNTASMTTNFYFQYGDLPTEDTWYLVVAYINPVGTVQYPRTQNRGGIYQYGSTTKVADILNEAVFTTGTTKSGMRMYDYYDTNNTGTLELYEPRLDIMDNAPSLEQLVGAPAT